MWTADTLFWLAKIALEYARTRVKSDSATNVLKQAGDVLLEATRQEVAGVLTRAMNEKLAREATEMGNALANFVMTRKTVD